ncbi:TPA: HD domain-containing protein [Streptococcus agalactiae]
MTMVKREDVILNATENMVYHKLKNDPSGHDWFHIVRVRNLAVELAHKEGANTFICQMAALLHDIIDDKIFQDSKQASYELTQWLYSQDLAIAEVEHILDILENISFKAGTGLTMKTLEGQIVQDADRLDAMGAIGIARTMAYSGSKGRLIHDPNLKPRENLTLEEYRNGQDTAIMHFYEKLLKLKDLMNTKQGKMLAQKRHDFLELYLAEFYAEWNGKG